jgi:hypothetical protein
MGYYAFVADIYGEGNYPKIHKKQENKLDITNNVGDYQRAHSVGIGPMVKSGANPDNIVVIGLCFGNGVLEAARAGMKVRSRIVSWWFRPRCSRVNNVIKKRVLVLMVQMIYMFLQLK